MFCPKCGQQSPDEVRFCPRCGLSLVPHAALLSVSATGAAPGLSAPPVRTKKQVSGRRAAKLMFFSVVLAPVFLALSFAIDSGEPMILPLFMFLSGLAWLVYAQMFVDDVPHEPSRKDLRAGAERPALGAAQFVPASSFSQRQGNTAEMAPPQSVTEHSTKLLDKDA
jgi:hypothetical protein